MNDVTHMEDNFNKLKIKASPMFSLEQMATAPLQVQLLQGLIVIGKCKNILEIGTFVGSTTLHLLSAAGDGASITTIEKFDKFADIARENFAHNNASKRIELLCGDAKDIIPKLQGRTFDFIFLDGDKGSYDYYFNLLEPLLKNGGIIVVDDCFFHGDVFHELPITEKGKGVQQFLQTIAKNENYHKTFIPLFNGMLVLVRK